MLWVPAMGGFEWSISNQEGASLTPGTSITPGNNSFPTPTEILSDTVVTEDCYGIFIRFSGNAVAGASRNTLVNIGADPAGGTSFTTIIPNLMASEAITPVGTFPGMGYDYYFPLYIKAGTALSASASVNNATVGTLRCFVKLFGKPKRKDMLKYGMKVDSFGEVTASSKGTDITPGNGAEGTYVQLGSNTTTNYFWWQCGFGIANSTITNVPYWLDLARGDGSNKQLIIQNEQFYAGTSESLSRNLWGDYGYQAEVPSGVGIYGRAWAGGSPVTGCSMMAYGVRN
jgi:hypothetical protein